jgi:hypothetical protein
MEVSQNKGTPKWMVIMENLEIPIKMDDLGGTFILGNHHIYIYKLHINRGFPIPSHASTGNGDLVAYHCCPAWALESGKYHPGEKAQGLEITPPVLNGFT